MPKSHHYDVTVRWTGNLGSGTSGYRDFARDHEVTAALGQCHMLWYLHLASQAGVVVTEYTDDPVGTMVEDADRGGWFTEVVLRPRVTVASPDMIDAAILVHKSAHEKCFLANSVNFPVRHEPVVTSGAGVSSSG